MAIGAGVRAPNRNRQTRLVRKRADKTNTAMVQRNLDSGRGMNNEVGLTEYDGGPVWTQPEVQALNALPNTQAAQMFPAQSMNTSTAPAGTSTATSPSGNGATHKANFGNEYWWASPEAAVGNAMAGLGMSTDINSSFFNAMQSLAPGLKWMSLLGGSPTGGIESFKDNVGGWMGSGGFGGGGLSTGLGALMSGGSGNAFLEGYIDAMDPRQMLAAIGQMAQTAGYGQIAPELLQGMQGLMSQAYSDFANNGADLLANVGQGVSDMDVFRDFFSGTGQTIMDYFGNLGW